MTPYYAFPELPSAYEIIQYRRDDARRREQARARKWGLVRYHGGAILDALLDFGRVSIALAFLSVSTAFYA
jgi:hypothetical protein